MQEIEYGLRGEVGVSDVERLERAKKIIKDMVEFIENVSHIGKEDTEYLDWIVSTVEKQQMEIERLNKAVEKEMHTGYSLEGQIHDVKEKLESENKHYRQLLLGVLKLKHVDEMFKRQISEALKG